MLVHPRHALNGPDMHTCLRLSRAQPTRVDTVIRTLPHQSSWWSMDQWEIQEIPKPTKLFLWMKKFYILDRKLCLNIVRVMTFQMAALRLNASMSAVSCSERVLPTLRCPPLSCPHFEPPCPLLSCPHSTLGVPDAFFDNFSCNAK